jgi:putative colanic acid biosynthesis acetyltransferase WcaF
MIIDAVDKHVRSRVAYRPSPHSRTNRAARLLWSLAWLLLFRPSPKPLHAWRRALLRLFGARLGQGVVVHASARVWAPWNLEMGDFSSLAPFVDCYCVDRIRLGRCVTVSQYSFLCTASHDIESPDMRLTRAPITLGDHVWIAADAFVGPGVTVAAGAVVGARASAFRDVPAWTVVAGNPAKPLRMRSRTIADALMRAAEP